MLNPFEILQQKLKPIACNHSCQKMSENRFPHCDLKVNLTKCAILILFFRKDEQFHLVFTVRSLKLKSYSGEICFPGLFFILFIFFASKIMKHALYSLGEYEV